MEPEGSSRLLGRDGSWIVPKEWEGFAHIEMTGQSLVLDGDSNVKKVIEVGDERTCVVSS